MGTHDRSRVLGTHRCDWHLKRGQSCGAEPLTSRVCVNPRKFVPQVNLIVGLLVGVHRELENCLMWKTHTFCLRGVWSKYKFSFTSKMKKLKCGKGKLWAYGSTYA